MFDCVMVDEKWFYLMADGVKIKLLPGMEVAIQPKVHHKCHIEKVMFLSCVARPLFNEDGSVSLWPGRSGARRPRVHRPENNKKSKEGRCHDKKSSRE